MSEQTNGSQDKNNLESPTLGNVPQLYPIEPTNSDYTKVRKGYLPELAVNVSLGIAMQYLSDEKLSNLVKGTGDRFTCHAVLMYLLAHQNALTGISYVSDSSIARDLCLDRGTVSKCKRVLILKGVIVDVGKGRSGVRKYAFPLLERLLSGAQGVVEPVVQGVVEPVSTQPHIQYINKYNNNDYKIVDEHFIELYPRALVDIPKDLQPKWNKTTAREFKRVMQYAPTWQAQPELYGQALKTKAGNRSSAGGYVQAMGELEYEPPKQPLQFCAYDNCNGNLHENNDTKEPYLCPKRVQ